MNVVIIISGILAVLCMGYFIFAASYAGVGSAFLGFWLLATVGFLGIMLVAILHKKKHILDIVPKAVKIVVLVLVLAGVLLFTTMEGLIVSRMSSTAEDGVDYLIILGAKVKGTKVTKSLAKRLDAAYDYLVENPDTRVICTGGQGPGEDITEAMAMKEYLVKAGIKEDRIILEQESTSTYENLKFAMNVIDNKSATVAIVTNNFHVYRGMYLAKKVGFKDVQGIAGKSDNRLLPNYMVREGLALAKELILR